MVLEEDCYFKDAVGGNHLYVQKTWELINRGSYSTNDLEEADYSILEWVGRLGFAHANMISQLLEAGIVARPTRFTDPGKRLAGPLHRTFRLVFRTKFVKNGVGINVPVYTVCFPYGARLLQHITGHGPRNHLQGHSVPAKTREVRVPGRGRFVRVEDRKALKEIRRTLALNQWFTFTAGRYKSLVRDYSLNTVFDTDSHFNGRANIHGYLQLGEQAFFAQAFRSAVDGQVDRSLNDKIERMGILATYYTSLMRYGQQASTPLTRPPVIVLIGESFAHCQALYEQMEDAYPWVRKLYTFDALLTSNEAYEGAGNYFEYVDGVPHSVRLEDVITRS